MNQRAIATILGLLYPGLGHCYLGQPFFGILFSALPWIAVSVVAWARLITAFTGFIALAALFTLIQVASATFAYAKARAIISPADKKPWVRRIVFLSITATTHLFLFIFKPTLFGFEVYSVQSQSMQPILSPGDHVMVDTWAYRDRSPQVGDVVVFRLTDGHSINLIKRVQPLPEYLPKDGNDIFYVVGDNRQRSIDSRVYGAIPKKRIIGQAKYIVMSAIKGQRKELGDLGKSL